MNKKLLISVLILFGLSLVAPTMVAAEFKIGVVNPTKILEASPQTDAARQLLEKEIATRDRD